MEKLKQLRTGGKEVEKELRPGDSKVQTGAGAEVAPPDQDVRHQAGVSLPDLGVCGHLGR